MFASLFGRRSSPGDGLLTVRVASVRDEAIGIRSFELIAQRGAPLPEFTPGAHVDVHLSRGLVRPYSICSDPADSARYVIAVKACETSRGGSKAMHERVAAGDSLAIGKPRNNFSLATGASRHLLLAAGIGITPLLCMARELARTKQSFELHYFVRSAAHAAFAGELQALGGDVHVHAGVGRERIAEMLRELVQTPGAGAHVYACGPQGFLASALNAAADWPRESVHFEQFHGDAAAVSRPRHSFQVRLARSRIMVPVRADESIVDALENHGFPLLTSCREGVCGTCITRVLDGECDHRDGFLSAHERASNRQILPCVSRARGKEIVLDL